MSGIDLDQAMKDGALIFQMPPAESQNNGEPLPAGEKPTDPAGGQQPPAVQAGEQSPAVQAGEQSPAAGEKQGEAEEKPQTRFKTHEDAEKGYTELQSRTSKAEQHNAELRKQLETYKVQEDKKNQQDLQVEIEQFAVSKNKEALAAINSLSPETEDYDDNVAKIWAKTNLEINAYQRTREAVQLPPNTPADQGGADQGAVDQGAADQDGAEQAAAMVTGMLESQQFSEAERIIFWGLSRSAPNQGPDGTPLTFEQQVSMTMDKARKFHAAQRSELMQEFNLPLERGGSFTGPAQGGAQPGAVVSLSLDDAIAEADRGRTLA